jgi:hypothetical protein
MDLYSRESKGYEEISDFRTLKSGGQTMTRDSIKTIRAELRDVLAELDELDSREE